MFLAHGSDACDEGKNQGNSLVVAYIFPFQISTKPFFGQRRRASLHKAGALLPYVLSLEQLAREVIQSSLALCP